MLFEDDFLIFFGKFDCIGWKFPVSEIQKKRDLSVLLFFWKLILFVEAIIQANSSRLVNKLDSEFTTSVFPSYQQRIQQSLPLMMSQIIRNS